LEDKALLGMSGANDMVVNGVLRGVYSLISTLMRV